MQYFISTYFNGPSIDMIFWGANKTEVVDKARTVLDRWYSEYTNEELIDIMEDGFCECDLVEVRGPLPTSSTTAEELKAIYKAQWGGEVHDGHKYFQLKAYRDPSRLRQWQKVCDEKGQPLISIEYDVKSKNGERLNLNRVIWRCYGIYDEFSNPAELEAELATFVDDHLSGVNESTFGNLFFGAVYVNPHYDNFFAAKIFDILTAGVKK